MTALKPIEWRHVKGVPSTKYPINERCAHPDCTESIDGVHHIFPRSQIGNSSYFVEITPENGETVIIPHAIGLCGSGTTGHHGDVEEHRAWIKLEDGVFVWYEAITRAEVEAIGEVFEQYGQTHSLWRLVGPLNPQPGSREGKPKRKRTVKGTQERAERKTVSIRLPEGVDGQAWDDLLASVQEKLFAEGAFDESLGDITVGKIVVDGLGGYIS